MLKTTAVVLLTVALGVNTASAAGRCITAYFDEQYTSNCVESVESIPTVVNVYFVLEQDQPYIDWRGWEAAIWSEEGVLLGPLALNGGPLRFGSGANYFVTYGTPIPGSGNYLIATATAYVTGAGYIYLSSAIPNSVPGSLSPCILDADYETHTIEYCYGSPVHPIATILDAECPEITSGDLYVSLPDSHSFIPPQDGEALKVVQLEPLTAQSVSNKSDSENVISDFDLFELCDLAFIGELRNVAFRAYYRGNSHMGIAVLSFDVERVYWGPPLEHVDVVLEKYDVTGVVSYEGFGNVFAAEELIVGRRFIVPVRSKDIGFRVFERMMVGEGGYAGADPASSTFNEVENEMISRSALYSFQGQSKSGVTVARGRVLEIDQTRITFDVLRCYSANSVESDRVTIDVASGTVYPAQIGKFAVDEIYILFLKKGEGGNWMLNAGHRSIMKISDDGYATGGVEVPPHPDGLGSSYQH